MTAALYGDLPYGVLNGKQGVTWDDPPQTCQLITYFKQFEAATTQDQYASAFLCAPKDVKVVRDALTDRGLQQLQEWFWYKPNQTIQGPQTQLVPCMEIGVIGYKPDRSQLYWNVPENPVLRHNCIVVDSIKQVDKRDDGMPINPTQKPPEVAAWWFKQNCKPGSTVVIIGTGAGGDVMGANMAGCNVIGVEKDETQYYELQKLLNKNIAQMRSEKEAAVAKAAKGKKHTVEGKADPHAISGSFNHSPSKSTQQDRRRCGECGLDLPADKRMHVKCSTCADDKPCHKTCLHILEDINGSDEMTTYECDNCKDEREKVS